MSDHPSWEAVIGLEVHLQLDTESKLFSASPHRFGDEPNTNIDPISLGMPGTLPKLNAKAAHLAVRLGLGLGSTIRRRSHFDRKSYYYPDAPRNYQITQFYEPILSRGIVTAWVGEEEKQFKIDRAHLEDDSGMLKHFTTFTGIDYNRAGAPLIEIVSTPCMHSAQEAGSYVRALKRLLQHLKISPCNMEQGHLRVDVNLSVRPRGSNELRPKVEIKNMNSITGLETAISQEILRQIALYERYPAEDPKQLLPSSTYRWDAATQSIILMREKESAHDYRYFPDPDLPALEVSEAFIEELKQTMPELPQQRAQRYLQSGLSPSQVEQLMEDVSRCEYFDDAVSSVAPNLMVEGYAAIANWILVEFTGRLKESGKSIETTLPARHIGELALMLQEGKITGKIAKALADVMVSIDNLKQPLSPNDIVAARSDFQPIYDESILVTAVEEVIKNFPQAVEDYHAGRLRAYGFLIGKIMSHTKGQGSPELINRLLKEALSKVGP